jgi:hypothetical protein
MGSSDQGVRTMRGWPFSTVPKASGTTYPTQSIIFTRMVAAPSRVTVTA